MIDATDLNDDYLVYEILKPHLKNTNDILKTQ